MTIIELMEALENKTDFCWFIDYEGLHGRSIAGGVLIEEEKNRPSGVTFDLFREEGCRRIKFGQFRKSASPDDVCDAINQYWQHEEFKNLPDRRHEAYYATFRPKAAVKRQYFNMKTGII